MATTTINDFVGTYTIRQGSQNGFQPDPTKQYVVHIGTNTHDDPPIVGSKVGVSFCDSDGNRIGPDTIPALFSFDEDTLTLQFFEIATRKRFQISLYIDARSEYKCVYGADIEGDPQEVGAWGADDNP